MNIISSDYHQEVLFRSALVAFFRDNIPTKVQLHWYFNGKTEGLLGANTPALHSILDELRKLATSLPILKRRNDWKRANRVQGVFDALAEMLALAEIAISNGTRTGQASIDLLKTVSNPSTPELERNIVRERIRAIECRGVFKETHQLYGYFEAKEKALGEALTMGRPELRKRFVEVREEAIEAVADNHACFALLGFAAGYGEGLAHVRSAATNVSTRRA